MQYGALVVAAAVHATLKRCGDEAREPTLEEAVEQRRESAANPPWLSHAGAVRGDQTTTRKFRRQAALHVELPPHLRARTPAMWAKEGHIGYV